MTDTTHAEIPESRTTTSAALPAILVGGPPYAGKSVLTYNLTRALLECDVPHYAFRASPDGEGNWYLKGNLEIVEPFREQSKRKWSPDFRELASHDIPKRQLPLLVDIGGEPREEDHRIFKACTHAILLLKEKDGPVAQLWHSYIQQNNLELIAEIYSQELGTSVLTATQPIITGTLTTKLSPQKRMQSEIFLTLLERVKQLFGADTPEKLERTRTKLEAWHMSQAPQGFMLVNLPTWHDKLDPDDHDPYKWTQETLQQLMPKLPREPLAVYGSGPAWLYSALALHAQTQPFCQFDARFGWRTPPLLLAGTPEELTRSTLKIDEPDVIDGIYAITLTPEYGYLDYDKMNQFVLPEPPTQGGVIIGGKLPLWFFTALARFYAQKNVSWIALNDAQDNQPVVIYSKVAAHPLGEKFPMPERE